MWRRQLAALVRNDLRIHGLAVAGQIGAILLLAAVLDRVPPARGGRATFANALLNLNVVVAVVLAEWLAAREKTKGTFAWLRTLPIGDRVIIGSKFVSAWICCSATWVITTVPFDRGYYFPDRWSTWLVWMLVCVTLSSAAMFLRLCFPQKRGLIVLSTVVVLLLGSAFAFSRSYPDLALRVTDFIFSGRGHALMVALLVACSGGLFIAAAGWMSRSETTRLLE
jgi:hypothetical protein